MLAEIRAKHDAMLKAVADREAALLRRIEESEAELLADVAAKMDRVRVYEEESVAKVCLFLRFFSFLFSLIASTLFARIEFKPISFRHPLN